MTLLHRRILYLVFVFLFFIITPAILFYAAGYNFDFRSGAIERTGILIIKTDPRGAQVQLGDKKKYNWLYTLFYGDKPLLTPLKLRNLLPDEYNVTVTKDGYFDYHKKITLYPGQTVVLDAVTLLKQSAPQPLVTENVIKTALAPDKTRLAAATDTSLTIIDLNTNHVRAIPLGVTSSSGDDFDIVWGPQNKKILLTLADWPLYNLETNQRETELARYFPVADAQVRWDTADINRLLFLYHNGIYAFDLAQKKSSLLFTAAGLQDFLLKGNTLYTVETRAGASAVTLYDAGTLKTLKTISLPGARSYEFRDGTKNLLYVYEPTHALLYLVDPFSFIPLQNSLSNVRDFNVSGSTIIYWNDFEIWSYDTAAKTNSLLTRISRPIETTLVDGTYILYNTPAAITSIERGDRDYLNITTLLDWQATGGMVINPNNTSLYFVSPYGERRALWQLDIK